MNVHIVTPASDARQEGSVTGNRVTAERWQEILGKLGHETAVSDEYVGAPCDVLVALHARKSAPSIQRFAKEYPNKPIVVALTGTDLYEDLPGNEDARRSLELAAQVVVLQPGALDRLDVELRPKTTVIYQSAAPMAQSVEKVTDSFQIALLAHLRPVKDPFLAAEAAATLSSSSRVRIVHAGGAVTEEASERALKLTADVPGYRWIGPIPHEQARLLIARSHLLLLTSRSEGAANVLSEALAIGVPILASRAPGVEGLLGEGYPGYFPVGDTAALRALLERVEHDEVFYRRLELACEKLAPMVAPSWELRSWQQLLQSLR